MFQKNLAGTGVALATPFKADGSVDFDSLRKLIHHVTKNGVDYLVALGTTGETPVLSDSEKKAIVDFIIEVNEGKLPVILGIGGNSTASVLEAIKNTDFKGVSSILSVSPYYNKPNQEGLYQHYKLIAENSPLPIILYNVPGRTGSNVSADTCLRLAHDFKGKIVAMKEASGNLAQVMAILKERPKDFRVISGDDALTFSILNLGGDGVISVVANAFPLEFSGMVNYCLGNDPEQARKLHYKLLPAIDLIFADGSPAGVKAFLHQMGVMENVLRLPLTPVNEALYKKITDYIAKA